MTAYWEATRFVISWLNMGQVVVVTSSAFVLVLVVYAHRKKRVPYALPVAYWLINVMVWQLTGLVGNALGAISSPSVFISSWGLFVIMHALSTIGALFFAYMHEDARNGLPSSTD